MNNEYIKLNNVNFIFDKTKFSLNNISISFLQNEFIVITGRNGSGKTTLSKLMIGILKPKLGEVLVDNINIKKEKLYNIAKNIGYLFQNVEKQLFCSTALKEVVFSLENNGVEKENAAKIAKEMLERFKIDYLEDKFPLNFSKGEKQILALICVIAMNPKYIILDEPLKNIDKETKSILLDILKDLKARGVGICVITHNITFIKQLTDRVITIDEGRIVSDEKY